MTILSYSFTRLNMQTLVQVTSDLANPTAFWYLDGVYYGRTEVLENTFYLEDGERADVFAVDTLTPEIFDIEANAPPGEPARRTLWWTRSEDLDVNIYRVQQQREAEGYVTIVDVPATDAWSYRANTPRLDDLTAYDWRIIPIDFAGNQGTALAIGPADIVREPDAPDFTITFDSGTGRVTFTAA